MVRGRPPKPTALKLIEGTARPDRINDREPEPPQGEIKPPKWLVGRSKRLWNEIAPVLDEMGVLTTADPHALALLCDAYAEYLDARAVVKKEGATYQTSRVLGQLYTESGEEVPLVNTMVRQRPEVAIASDAWRRIQRMMSEFGLTPSSRSRIKASPKEEIDPFEEFLGGSKRSG